MIWKENTPLNDLIKRILEFGEGFLEVLRNTTVRSGKGGFMSFFPVKQGFRISEFFL